MPINVRVASAIDAPQLSIFAATRPLVWTDFSSVALLNPDEPRVLVAVDSDSDCVVAATIDDGLAMSVAGSQLGLQAISSYIDDVDSKLVIAGRTEDTRAFLANTATNARSERFEYFMAVKQNQLLGKAQAIPMRIAQEDDLPLLLRVRTAALAEEYGMEITNGTKLHRELETALRRAIEMQGIAIWVENELCAFTAQLIAKTPEASMFGDLYVDPPLRGHGRATRALTTFCTWLMTESEHVVLRVGQTNAPALRLYERVGFTIVDEFLTSLRKAPPQ